MDRVLARRRGGQPRRRALKAGDGVVFDAADWRSPQEPEEGGRIFEARLQRDGKLELRFANRAVNFSRIRAGDLVWRTNDPDLDKAVRALPVHSQIVDVNAVAREGAPLETSGRCVTARCRSPSRLRCWNVPSSGR